MINMTEEVLFTFENFQQEPSQESYEQFKASFIEANSEELWSDCIEFWCRLGGADLYDYSHEETLD